MVSEMSNKYGVDLTNELEEVVRQAEVKNIAPLWIDTDELGRKRINAPVLAGAILDSLKLYKRSDSIFDSSGKRYTDEDLEKALRDMVLPHMPTISMDVIRKTCLLALLDKIPDKSIDVSNDGVASYIANLMPQEMDSFTRSGHISTGFPDLDRKTDGLYPGLYCIGAISSLGKTTLCHQLSDNLATDGNHVLFFSLEMSRLEMVSKSIARMAAKLDLERAIDSLKIRRGITNQLTAQARQAYIDDVGDRLNIIEGSFDTTVAFIGDYARRYIESHNVQPVIVVDYLQVLQGAPKGTAKEAVDFNILELKRLSRALKVPVIVVSSVNRSNYQTPIDFEAFKESGSIEFTADCVWGLQLTCMDEPLFEKEKATVEKRKRIKAAKSEIPRKVSLVCLKNRYGRTDWQVDFVYYPNHDLFVESDSWKEVKFENDNPFI